jgi:hypothetical protein
MTTRFAPHRARPIASRPIPAELHPPMRSWLVIPLRSNMMVFLLIVTLFDRDIAVTVDSAFDLAKLCRDTARRRTLIGRAMQPFAANRSPYVAFYFDQNPS